MKTIKKDIIEIISNCGTWQTDNNGMEGTWVDTESIDGLADEIVKYITNTIHNNLTNNLTP